VYFFLDLLCFLGKLKLLIWDGYFGGLFDIFDDLPDSNGGVTESLICRGFWSSGMLSLFIDVFSTEVSSGNLTSSDTWFMSRFCWGGSAGESKNMFPFGGSFRFVLFLVWLCENDAADTDSISPTSSSFLSKTGSWIGAGLGAIFC